MVTAGETKNLRWLVVQRNSEPCNATVGLDVTDDSTDGTDIYDRASPLP